MLTLWKKSHYNIYMENIEHQLIIEIEEFCSKYKLSVYDFGNEAVKDSKLVWRLRKGLGISSTNINRIRKYINSHSKR